MSEELENLRRMVSNLIRIASVVEINAEEAMAKVKFMDTTTSWVPWITGRAGGVRHWSAPSIGEQIVMLCPNGSTEQAMVLPALFQDKYPQPSQAPEVHLMHFSDGAILAYDDRQHRLTAHLPDEATTLIDSIGGLTLLGDVKIVGRLHATASIHADGDVSDGIRAMAEDRGIYNSHKHGDSPPPSPRQ